MTTGRYVEYDTNNSGGDWWLTDDDWKALEAAGWEVEWFAKDPFYARQVDADGRWLDGLAGGAKRRGLSLRMARAEWQDITGQSPDSGGCSCCGQPHSFYEYDEDDRMVW